MKKFFKFGCLGFIALIVLIIIIAVATSGGDDGEQVTSNNNGSTSGEVNVDKTVEEKEESNKEVAKEEDDVPNEYKSALNKAESYAKSMHMSKSAISEQLTSEYGEKFSAESAEYAMEART